MCNTLIHLIIGRKQSLLRFNRAPGDALGAPRSEVHSPSRAGANRESRYNSNLRWVNDRPYI